MSVFQQLLQIREFREQRAQAAVQAERAALRRATEARDAASAELDTFKAYAQAREAALFGHLLARVVQVRDIQDVRHEVGELRVKERGHAQALEHAEEQRTKQSQALDAARAGTRRPTVPCRRSQSVWRSTRWKLPGAVNRPKKWNGRTA